MEQRRVVHVVFRKLNPVVICMLICVYWSPLSFIFLAYFYQYSIIGVVHGVVDVVVVVVIQRRHFLIIGLTCNHQIVVSVIVCGIVCTCTFIHCFNLCSAYVFEHNVIQTDRPEF